MKQKKFKGIYEYYQASDHDKATTAYYISVRNTNGMPSKIKTDATTPEEAVTALAHYKACRSSSPVTQNNKLTLLQLAAKFFAQRTTSNNNKEKRRFELHVEPILGKTLISKISKQDLLKLQASMQKKQVPASLKADAPLIHLTPKTINNITDITARVMQWGYDQELVSSPLPKIEKLRVDNERQRVFTKAELNTIFRSTEGNTLLFLLLAYHTAQRPESILRLQKKHIVNGSILIEAIKHQSSHLVPISSKLEEVLIPWIENLSNDDYIITQSKRPMPYQTMSGRVSKVFKKLFNKDLDYKKDSKMWASMYTLRHTALTNIYANTSDIYAAQSIANHSSVQMTQRYAKHSEKLKRHAVEGL
jgi:integrase